MVSEGGAANENRSLSVSRASTSVPVQSALVKGAPAEVLCVGECTPLLYTLFLTTLARVIVWRQGHSGGLLWVAWALGGPGGQVCFDMQNMHLSVLSQAGNQTAG